MSMNAIKGASPINNMYALSISNTIIKSLLSDLNIKACTLGSTGKKKDDEYSGDIDIAIEMEMTDENIQKIKDFLEKRFKNNLTSEPQYYIMKGLNILSFAYHYQYGMFLTDQIAQVDLMFCDNIEFTKFVFHAPNYRKNESAFKGMYRTNLLVKIIDNIPIKITETDQKYHPVIRFVKNGVLIEDDDPILNETFQDDSLSYVMTDFWKYSFSFTRGIKLTHKSRISQKTGKLLKNFSTVAEDDELITKDKNEIIKMALGDKGTEKDLNSFESVISYLFSDKFPYPEKVSVIINDFLLDPRHEEKKPELIKYIINVLMDKFSDADKEKLVNQMLSIYSYSRITPK
jgi:hypothetical protein